MLLLAVSLPTCAHAQAGDDAAQPVDAGTTLEIDADESTVDAAESIDDLSDEIMTTEIAMEIDADGSIDDAEASIDDVSEEPGRVLSADVRASYVHADLDAPDRAAVNIEQLRLRWRVGGAWSINEQLRAVARLAGICSSEDCSPDFYLRPEIPTAKGLADGQLSFDELFLHGYRSDRWDFAIGRMQTKFVARGGVYAKSLDRNDSNNLRVNWTDGLQSTFRMKNGWNSHLILEYNSKDGASNVRQQPLDFSVDRARTSAFLALENLKRGRFLLQRGLDISYLPAALLQDGNPAGRRRDYWGIVARLAGQWPMRAERPRLRLSGEFGHAPSTQSRAAAGLAGNGDVAGWAWNVTASIMDFSPHHNIGINYGRTAPGWLLSPQYEANEELFEMRYMWRKNRKLAVDIRGRWRSNLYPLDAAVGGRDDFDVYFRVTRGSRSN